MLFVNRELHFIIKQVLDSKIHESMSKARVNVVVPIRGASYTSYPRYLSLRRPERKIEATTGRVFYSFNSASDEVYHTSPLSKSYVVLKFPETGNSDSKLLKAIFETSEELAYSSDEATDDELGAQHRDEEHHEEIMKKTVKRMKNKTMGNTAKMLLRILKKILRTSTMN